jgi:chemotaxis methyl-accepting protein methylase
VFAQIESELPDLLRAARTDARRPLRVWSAGCSEGAELYSVAMLLAELNALDACELLGTDCREEALGCAAAGRFGPCILRGLSAERLERFTFPDGDDRSAVAAGQRRVNQNLRAVARWRRGNLIAGSEAGPWDLVLCRNMAMYLQPLAAKRLWRGLVSSIRPGGLLVLGKAERPCPAVSAELSPVAACVYRRRLRHHGVP